MKVEKTRLTGVQKCTLNKEVYYRGRVYLNDKDFYTDKCSTATEASKLRVQLKEELILPLI